MTPLLIDDDARKAIAQLRATAARAPVNVDELKERLADPEIKRTHMAQMGRQTIELAFGWHVTYSIETGHPVGTCRHLSMSSPHPNKVPNPHAVAMVCEEFGFSKDLINILHFKNGTNETGWTIYVEDLERPNGRRQAINVVEPLAALPMGQA